MGRNSINYLIPHLCLACIAPFLVEEESLYSFSFTIKTGINRGPAKIKIKGKYVKNPKPYNTLKNLDEN